MGWFRDRWATFGEVAGVRKYIIGATIAAIVAAFDQIENQTKTLLAKWLELTLEVGEPGVIFGFPSWIVGLTVLFFLLWWWTLEYAVKLRRRLNPGISISFDGHAPWVHEVPATTRSRADPSVIVATTAIFVRFQVANTTPGTVVRGCEAYLRAVLWRDSNDNFVEVSSGDSLRLSWAAQPKRLSFGALAIPFGVNVFCDLLSVDKENNEISVKWIVPLNANAEIFHNHGIYRFDVVAISQNGGPVNQSIFLEWEGQWDQIRTWME